MRGKGGACSGIGVGFVDDSDESILAWREGKKDF